MKTRSRLPLVAAATAIALVWFLPGLSSVVAQSSPVDTSTTSSSTTSSSTSTSTSSTTTSTTIFTPPPVSSIILQLGATSGAPGDPIGLSGQGSPNSTIGLTFNSTPVFLGNFTTDGNGNFVMVFNVPLSADPGLHTIVARGANGEQGTVNFTVTVGAPGVGYPTAGYPYGALPLVPTGIPTSVTPAVQTTPAPSGPAFTGVNVSGLLTLAAAVLALGVMVFSFGRLQPELALPRRRRLQWAHRHEGSRRSVPRLDPTDVTQIVACVALAVLLGLSLAR